MKRTKKLADMGNSDNKIVTYLVGNDIVRRIYRNVVLESGQTIAIVAVPQRIMEALRQGLGDTFFNIGITFYTQPNDFNFKNGTTIRFASEINQLQGLRVDIVVTMPEIWNQEKNKNTIHQLIKEEGEVFLYV